MERNLLSYSINLIFVLFLFSCKKNTIEVNQTLSEVKTDMQTIDGHIESVQHIALKSLPTNVKAEMKREDATKIKSSNDQIDLNKWDLDSISLIKYFHSPITIYQIQSKKFKDLSMLIFFNEGKYFKVLASVKNIGGELQKLTFTSPEGLEYFEFIIFEGKYGSHLAVKNDLPFKKILNTSHNQSRLAPQPPPLEDGCTDLPFDDCMNCAVKECNDDWKCWLMCSVAPIACAGGWAIGCA